MRVFRYFYLVLFCLCFAVLQTDGQAVTGSVLGTITDSSGAVVSAAAVTLTETSTQTSRQVHSNASGNYFFPDVPPGEYSVSVELTGFKKEVRGGITVNVNASPRADVQLQPGDVSQTVEVTAAPPMLQTDRADTSTNISVAQTQNLPTGTNRNFQGLLNLVPGTTRANFQHSQFFNAQSSLQTEVNGQMRMGNNYQIEGIDDNERTGLLQILVPPIEAIQTVDVSTSNFEAELGRASGAVVNVVLKSGTNEIHGAAYEFLQNSNLNARSFFSPSVGHLAYNYFGGNVGGPILKNKWFYFGDFLRVSDHEANTNLLTIPTMAERSGDLSASTTAIYDPGTGNADGTGRSKFLNNKIDPTRINPISAAILNLLPVPNVASANGANNYFALLPYHKDTNSYDIKSDYVATDADRLSVRFSYQRPEVFQAPVFGLAGGPAQGAFEGTGIQRTYSAGINYDHVFTPTLVAEFRAGVAYYNNVATPADKGLNQASALGIPGVNLDQITSGIVGVDIGSFFSSPLIGYSASLPWTRAEANIDFANTWTKTFGNHTIKWGVDYRSIRDALLQEQTFSPRGVYSFAAGQTALNTGTSSSKTSYFNNFAGFLLDLPNRAGRDLATYFPSYRAWQFFSFVQDKWVATPKLTVDLGLRWEFYPPATPQFKGGFSNYNPVDNTLEIAGIGNIPSNLGIKTKYSNFAPRLGLAYRFSDATVVRAGFGISYTPFPDNSYAYNYPVRANNEYDSVTSYRPALLYTGQLATFQNGFPPSINPAVPSNGIITNPPVGQTYYVVNNQFKNPYVESWNLAVQRALPWKLTLDVAYVGNHGVDSAVNYNLNAGLVPGAGAAGQPEYSAFHRTANTQLLFAGYSSMYNALQVKLDRRLATDLMVTTAYTYGRGMSYQSGDDGGLDFYVNQRRNYARNDYDRTHTFSQSYMYTLPFGPGKRWLTSGFIGNIFGNWQANAVLGVMTGTPVTITADGTALNMPNNTQTANQVAPVKVLHGIGPNHPWFDPTSFAQPTQAGVFGNTGRNIFSGPGLFNLDASLFKLISIKERFKLEIRGEAFSVTNTAHFTLNPGGGNASGNTNISLTNPTFGYVTSTLNGDTGARTFQLGAKLTF
jgi:outer membrane receptor protein involved in Fe transport